MNAENNFFKRTLSKFIDLFMSTYVGIDITVSEMRVITTKRGRIRKWGSVPLAESIIKDGIIQEPQTLGLVIDNLLTSLKLPRNRVICSVTGFPFVYRVINMPYTDRPVDKEAIERAAKKEMSLSETDMYLFWKPIEKRTEPREIDFLVFGLPRYALGLLVDTLDKARVKRYMLDVKPLSVARVVSSDALILTSLEKEYVDIVVVAGGIARVMHGFAPAHSEDTNTLKREVLNGINSAVKSFNRDYPGIPLPADAPVFTCGELAGNADLTGFLAENSGHPVSSAAPPFAGSAGEMSVPRYSSALGLVWKIPGERPAAANPTAYKDININFFSALNRPLTERLKISYVLTVIVVVALAAAAYFSFDLYRQASDRFTSLSQAKDMASLQLTRAKNLNKDAVALKAKETANLEKLQKQYALLENEYQYINSLQPEVADEIIFIMQALPEQSRYTQISLTGNGYTVKGEAASLSDVLICSDALEKDAGFNSLIRSVANSEPITFEINISRK